MYKFIEVTIIQSPGVNKISPHRPSEKTWTQSPIAIYLLDSESLSSLLSLSLDS